MRTVAGENILRLRKKKVLDKIQSELRKLFGREEEGTIHFISIDFENTIRIASPFVGIYLLYIS